MKVLVIGGGGREHALVWKLSQSRHVDKIYCVPGNAGIAEMAECLDVGTGNFDELVNLVRYEWIDLTVVGPEEPLSRGIVDAFEKEGRRVVGPTKAAARLEASKVFSKDFMKRHRIPSAEYKVFTSYLHAEDYVRMKGAPIVIKADGLAAGKGVIVAATVDEAIEAIKRIMKDKEFGDAGNRVIVEECLQGEEASFMAFTDGKTIVPMVSSQDHKRVFDNDEGPNTGGMGAYSPAPVVTPELQDLVMEKIMLPTVNGLRAEGIKYKGILYAGLMIKDGVPSVLEFNCRLGDPETQPVLARLDSDLMDIFMAIADEKLAEVEIAWKEDAAVCVVLASKGYPGPYEKGKVIAGLDTAKEVGDAVVFHAGTSFNNGDVVTNGGRVLGVTGWGKDIGAAKERAYEAVGKICFEGMHYRKDIADKALKR
ncbi:MAG: phosphoribosylamine--glycine ligase [Alphaproteobacteria bacterium]|uniref:Phosphoribosylamine--glycine ligase n=1 Tax=Candidatus Nitrobium versatile TaxID=2884831 RepID=A0A953JEL6_9BACT|nr:phosphoribosylamine--glycine ligase [Candidatus Nitrobium versatile]